MRCPGAADHDRQGPGGGPPAPRCPGTHAYLAYLAAIPEAYAPSPEEQAEQLQSLARLDRLLDGLPPKARSAFLLSQLDGLTYPEIAERLGVSLSSVQQYMLRAMSACYAAFYG